MGLLNLNQRNRAVEHKLRPRQFKREFVEAPMPHSKANHLPELARHVLRPALVEAKLMTEKHVHDEVYAITVAEELRTVELKIAALEEALGVKCTRPSCGGLSTPCHAEWFHAKSAELDIRLRQIEQTGEN